MVKGGHVGTLSCTDRCSHLVGTISHAVGIISHAHAHIRALPHTHGQARVKCGQARSSTGQGGSSMVKGGHVGTLSHLYIHALAHYTCCHRPLLTSHLVGISIAATWSAPTVPVLLLEALTTLLNCLVLNLGFVAAGDGARGRMAAD